jgi:hypothetical protein
MFILALRQVNGKHKEIKKNFYKKQNDADFLENKMSF